MSDSAYSNILSANSFPDLLNASSHLLLRISTRIWFAHFCPVSGTSYCTLHSKSNAMWAGWFKKCSIWYNTAEKRSFMAWQRLLWIWASIIPISTWFACSTEQHITTGPDRSCSMGYWDCNWGASPILYLKGRYARIDCISIVLWYLVRVLVELENKSIVFVGPHFTCTA